MPAARILLWVASLGGVAVLVRTLLIDPLPLWLAVVLMLLYGVLTALGWVFPQLQMYGDAVWRGRAGAGRVALTFDDGPHPETTRKVLGILGRGEHKATFFVVGRKALAHPEVVREIHEAGHTLGVHGFTHDRLYSFKPPRQVLADIQATQRAVEQACGVGPTLFRPPIGHVSPRTAAGAKRAGVRIVAWNVTALDGFRERNSDRVARRVLRGMRDGAIVLLHDAAEHDDFEPASIAALPAILEQLDNRGLKTVGVEEFVAEAS